MLYCIFSFATKGQGTLSPFDPTKKLVKEGLYNYSRNPMYVGVLLILIGETLVYKSMPLALYTLGIFVLFHLFIVFVEEPRLKRDFGDQYIDYQRKVRRWV